MFRRDLIGELNRIGQIFRLDKPAIVVQSALDEFATGELWQLVRNLAFDRPQNFSRSGDQPDAFMAGTVLGLRQQISSGKFWIRGIIREHEHLAGAWQKVN